MAHLIADGILAWVDVVLLVLCFFAAAADDYGDAHEDEL